MRLLHSGGHSTITGKNSEKEMIELWCQFMALEDHRFMIMVDDSDEFEVSITFVVSGTTQLERQELAQSLKPK